MPHDGSRHAGGWQQAGRKWQRHAAATLGYLLLALLHTYPLVRHLGTHLPGEGLGDNVSFVWNVWWMRQALAAPALDFFATPPLLTPVGASLALHTHTALSGLIAATLLGPVPPLVAQNVLLIAALALNGVSAYALSLAAGARYLPAVAAGALFLTAPPVAGRLMGHFNLVVAWPLVFACVAVVLYWKRQGARRAAAVGVAAAVIPYSDYYYAVFFAVFAVLYTGTQLWTLRATVSRREHRRVARLLAILAVAAAAAAVAIALNPAAEVSVIGIRISLRTPTNALTAAWLLIAAAAIARWRLSLALSRRAGVSLPWLRHLGLAVITVLVLVAPLVLPVFQLFASGDYVTQTSSLRSSPRGVDAATVVLGPPFSGAIGPHVRGLYRRSGIDPMEGSAWLGVTTLLLLAWALRRHGSAPDVRRWTVVAACFAVWSLGPYLVVLGANTGVLLPQALATVIPVLNNARIPGRAMVPVALAIAVIIALALGRNGAQRRRLAAAAIALAVIEGLAAPLPLVAPDDPGVYAEVRADRAGGSVLPIPLGIRDGFGAQGFLEHDAIYQQTVHGHPLVGGFLARVPPRVSAWYNEVEPYRTLLELSSGASVTALPSCGAVRDGLARASVAFVVVYRADMSEPLRRFTTGTMPLREIAADPQRTLFRVDGNMCPGG